MFSTVPSILFIKDRERIGKRREALLRNGRRQQNLQEPGNVRKQKIIATSNDQMQKRGAAIEIG